MSDLNPIGAWVSYAFCILFAAVCGMALADGSLGGAFFLGLFAFIYYQIFKHFRKEGE